MAAPAEKLEPTESPEEQVLELPPLPKGEVELYSLSFPGTVRFLAELGTRLQVGRNFNEFDITGQVVRIAVKANGLAYVLIRTGGRPSSDGQKILGGKFREVLFFPNGMYGPVKE